MILVFIYVFLDGTISNVMSTDLYRFSPVGLCQLSYYNGDMARNGSGKTVLLKSICGFMPLTEGEILHDGKRC